MADPAGPDHVRASRSRTIAVVLGVVLGAVVVQAFSSMNSDVSWLLEVAQRTLDGAVPYRDFLETNPPASILIYVPAVWLARLAGLQPESVTEVLVFFGTALSLLVCAGILRRARPIGTGRGSVLACAACFVLLVMPLNSFSQREHIVLLALLPMLASLTSRVAGSAPPVWAVALAGVGAGIALSIKPIFGLALLGPLAFLLRMRSWRAVAFLPEAWLAGAVTAAYGVAVTVFCPDYLSRVLPLLLTIYVPARLPLTDLLSAPPVWIYVPLIVTYWRCRSADDTLGTVLALASAGFEASFLIQGKGFFYHGYPAVALAALACAIPAADSIAAGEGGRRLVRYVPAAVAIAGSLVVFAEYSRLDPALPGLKQAIWSISPHPRVLTISGDMAFGRAFARELDGQWVASGPLAWITTYAMAITLQAQTDPRFKDAIDMERDLYAADIERARPDVVLVVGDGWMRWARRGTALAAALSPYRTAGRYGAIILMRRASPTTVSDAGPAPQAGTLP